MIRLLAMLGAAYGGETRSIILFIDEPTCPRSIIER